MSDDLTIGGCLGLLFAGGCVCVLIAVPFIGGCAPHYSDGQRTGVVTKISHKGLVYKSWEGSLNLGGASADGNGNVVPNNWNFSLVSDECARQVESAANGAKRITVHYRQYLIHPVRIETDYVVESVEVAP